MSEINFSTDWQGPLTELGVARQALMPEMGLQETDFYTRGIEKALGGIGSPAYEKELEFTKNFTWDTKTEGDA